MEGELKREEGLRADAAEARVAVHALHVEMRHEAVRLEEALREAERLQDSTAEAHEEALAGARREVREAESLTGSL